MLVWWMSVPQCRSREVDTSICVQKYWNDVRCRLTGWMLWPQWGGVILFKIQGGSGWFGTIIWVWLTEGQVVVGKWFWSIAKLDMQTDCQRVSRHNLEWEYSEFRKRHF